MVKIYTGYGDIVAGGAKVEENRWFEMPVAAGRKSVGLSEGHGVTCSFIR